MANRTISDKAKDLARSLAEYTLPTPEIIQIPIGELNITLNARILWPPAVQKNLSHFYPLIVKVYGGPNSQQVDEQWSAGFDDFLAGNWHQSSRTIFQKERLANRNVTFNILQRRGPSAIQPPPIVLTVDPRGTCCRGLEFMFSVNRRLGFYEAKDVVAAVKRFVSDSPFIDPDKVGVWGWSYGGYLTAKIIEADFQSTASIFKSAVSVAPVTDWLLYDSIYTERYMKRPADNKEAYRESAVSNVQALKSIRYLAIHGTADDNVHVEQSLRLEYLFRLDSPNNGTNYRLHLVADDNHSMYRTANARTFVFRTLTDWMVNAWQEIDDLRRT
jgi:dipeptidyl aminopeptidase/acylaminoacyl peptidase